MVDIRELGKEVLDDMVASACDGYSDVFDGDNHQTAMEYALSQAIAVLELPRDIGVEETLRTLDHCAGALFPINEKASKQLVVAREAVVSYQRVQGIWRQVWAARDKAWKELAQIVGSETNVIDQTQDVLDRVTKLENLAKSLREVLQCPSE